MPDADCFTCRTLVENVHSAEEKMKASASKAEALYQETTQMDAGSPYMDICLRQAQIQATLAQSYATGFQQYCTNLEAHMRDMH